MRHKYLEHILSIILITVLLGTIFIFVHRSKKTERIKKDTEIESYLNLQFIDFDRPFDKALLRDVLAIYEPNKIGKHDSLLTAIDQYRKTKLLDNIQSAHLQEQLSFEKILELLKMYIKFIIIYIIVMVLTYYGVQTSGVLRFVRKQQKKQSSFLSFVIMITSKPNSIKWIPLLSYYSQALFHLFKAIVKALVYLILFSPAYVIAYSLKTEFNTDTILFMILLGVISNGLLITYTNKFYTFLVTESRKGYVQTAIVKNLNNSFAISSKSTISLQSIFNFRKRFKGHVFEHIFMNARFQYLSTIKEQASFLITGLIIIEMALNIQGHLNYELLQQILYRNFDIVIVIILGIFYVVKSTEIFADFVRNKESQRYENVGI